MLKKRIIITLTFLDGVLFRTKNLFLIIGIQKILLDYGVDEIILIDISKKKFSKSFKEIINHFSKNCFVPISVGGGISKIEHADDYFKNGADKIILGSKIILNKEIISKISSKYGNQSIIQSIDIKKNESSEYNLVINSGKELTKINPENAIKTALENGAGEILINNVDFDGSLLGYDLENN